MLRLLVGTAVALVLGAALALAAPGLSTNPYVPEVVEFEMDAPLAPAGIAANRGFVSRELRAEKRFNLVGFSWQGSGRSAIALRARKDGDAWTRWTSVGEDGVHNSKRSTSSPVWVGEADWVQYRTSRRVPGLRLHFVNTTGTATAGDRLLNSLRRAAHTAVVSIAPAWGAAAQPRIHSRAEWGASQCPTRGVNYATVKAATVHHTVTANEYTRSQVPAAILAVCRFHRNTNGWNDIGYNFVVDRFGRLWEGRAGGIDEAVMGSHAQGYNSQTTGIANLGTFTSVPQSEAAISAMVRLVAWKLGNHGVPTHGTVNMTSAGGSSARYPYGYTRRFERILGHRDTGVTACPGEQLYYQLSELRERVGERRPAGQKTEMTAPLPEVITWARGGSPFSGALTDAGGFPVGGVTVELQRLRRTGWKRLEEAVTDENGNFSVTARFKKQTVLRWEFAGDDTYRPFRGDGVAVAVAPLITLDSSTAESEPGQRIDVSGTIDPGKSEALGLVIERYEAGRWRRVERKKVAAQDGTFTKHPSFDTEGTYRLSVRFAGDLLNAPGASPYIEVDVAEALFPF
ncbi:MAG: N-acetylmuramoyl-L-alanine amidase [Thermoleophilaceae bacterium]